MRWRWPYDRFAPASATRVRAPSGSSPSSASMPHSAATRATWRPARVASGAQVPFDRTAQQRQIGHHDAERAPQFGEPIVVDRPPGDQHFARLRFDEPGRQRQQRRFAGAARADDRDPRTGRRERAEFAQRRADADAAELKRYGVRRAEQRPGRVAAPQPAPSTMRAAASRRGAARNNAIFQRHARHAQVSQRPAEFAEHRRHQPDQGDRADELGRGQCAGRNFERPRQQHRHRGERAAELRRRLQHRESAGLFDHRRREFVALTARAGSARVRPDRRPGRPRSR